MDFSRNPLVLTYTKSTRERATPDRWDWEDENHREWTRYKSESSGEEYKYKTVEARFRTNKESNGQDIVDILAAIGIPVLVQRTRGGKTMEVTALVPHDGKKAFERLRTRGAGRRVRMHFGKYPEINDDTTVAEFMRWREAHSPEECASALGLSRSAYYRVLAKFKSADPDKDLFQAVFRMPPMP